MKGIGRGIYLRGEIYWFSQMRQGARKTVSLETKDEAEALARADRVRKQWAADEPGGEAGELAVEIERFVAECSRSGRWSRQTTRVHGAALREFLADLGDRQVKVSQIRAATAEGHYRRLQGRLKETGAQIRIRALKTFFGQLVKERKIVVNPFEKVRLRHVSQMARTRFCSREERDRLIAAAPDDDLRFILLCGFHAGMRRGEIVEARTNWFQGLGTSGAAVHVQNTPTFRLKDRENRFIPLTADFRAFLPAKLAGLDGNAFPLRPAVKHGVGTYRYDFIRPFTDHCKAQGLGWVTPHVMRKTFASLLVQSGVSIYKVAAWIGDGVEVAQRHYAHLAPQDAEIEKLL